MARKPGQGSAQLAANEAYLQSPEGAFARGEARRDAAAYAKGLENLPGESLKPGREAAEMAGEGGLGRYLGDTARGLLKGSFSPHGAGKLDREQLATADALEAQALKLGAPKAEIDRAMGSDGITGGFYSPKKTHEIVGGLSDVVKKYGGDPADSQAGRFAGMWGSIDKSAGQDAASNDRMVKLLEEQNKLLAQIAANGGGAAPAPVGQGNNPRPVAAPPLRPPPAVVGGARA